MAYIFTTVLQRLKEDSNVVYDPEQNKMKSRAPAVVIFPFKYGMYDSPHSTRPSQFLKPPYNPVSRLTTANDEN
jgi:hypothetical protein